MIVFEDWWSSSNDRQKNIAVGLVSAALRNLPDVEREYRRGIAEVILECRHQVIECGERQRFLAEYQRRCNDLAQELEEQLQQNPDKKREKIAEWVENAVLGDIESKAAVLGLVLKESNDLSYLAEIAVKILHDALVDHEADIETLVEETRMLEKEIVGEHGEDHLEFEMEELIEWEIDLEGCPNLDCQHNNPPGTDRCKKCGVSLFGECPECYNEIPINTSYCRVCGKMDLEDWGMVNRYAISMKKALKDKMANFAVSLLDNVPEEVANEPEIVTLKNKLQKIIPRQDEKKDVLAIKTEDLCHRWIVKIQEIISEKRPNFVIASRALNDIPQFLKNEKIAHLRLEIEEKRKQIVQEGRNRKRTLLLQQLDILQEKAEYREALAEVEKFLPVLEHPSLVQRKQELQEIISEIDKLKSRLQGPEWARPAEVQKKNALRDQIPIAQEFDLGQGVMIKFILIPSGSFIMGVDDGYENVRPAHKVEITNHFYLGITPVTQEQWLAINSTNPSNFVGMSKPVEQITWQECCNYLLALTKKFGGMFRLPTEAEWEYACRAGGHTCYSFGSDNDLLRQYAWYSGNSEKSTQDVAQLESRWGLYDMHGNVWEWCQDCYDEKYYSKSPLKNPMGPPGGFTSPKVCRGGAWNSIPSDLYCYTRQGFPANYRNSHIGFRPLLMPKL